MTTTTTMTTIDGLAALSAKAALVPHRIELGPLRDDDVEISVECCAICHSDLHLLDDDWGTTTYPLVPGHEIVGRVRRAGASVREAELAIGSRVGLGWQSGACWACHACRSGREHLCPRGKERTCVGRPGGLADLVRADRRFVFPIPDTIASAEAAPLLCAGATVYSPLERLVARPGLRVGVIGLGGLGHLAVQFAAAMGSEVTAFDPIPAKRDEAERLGARRFAGPAPGELRELKGSFDVLLSTTHAPLDWDGWMRLLDFDGTLCLVGIPPTRVDLNAGHLLDGQKSLTGSIIASPACIRRMLSFAAEHGIRPWVERMPMREANAGILRVREGKARYRVVLER